MSLIDDCFNTIQEKYFSFSNLNYWQFDDTIHIFINKKRYILSSKNNDLIFDNLSINNIDELLKTLFDIDSNN